MIKVDFKVRSEYQIDRDSLREMIGDFLEEKGIDNAKVGVVVIGDRKMKELNEKYLGKEGTTDVLSFSLIEDEGEFMGIDEQLLDLGEVVVSWPQAMKQALSRQVKIDEEIEFLVQHGLLHLLGIHHD